MGLENLHCLGDDLWTLKDFHKKWIIKIYLRSLKNFSIYVPVYYDA